MLKIRIILQISNSYEIHLHDYYIQEHGPLWPTLDPQKEYNTRTLKVFAYDWLLRKSGLD